MPIVETAESPVIDVLLRLRAAKERMPNEGRLIRHLKAESQQRMVDFDRIGRQPIAALAEQAERESREFEGSTGTRVSALADGAIGRSFADGQLSSPSVIAWHEPTAVVPSTRC